jgi:Raf kinase inhibitor-like YbhB/YbcL family protein
MRSKFFLILPLILIIIFGFSKNLILNCKSEKKNTELIITSKAFAESEMIPSKYTCDAENISPEISWSKGPDNTKTYAMICDDPDAPSKVWVHWVVYNIPSNVEELNEKFSTDSTYNNIVNGINDFKTLGYSGPCPPSGTHHYHFKIYALDCKLNLKAGSSKADLETAMKDHILASGILTGKFKPRLCIRKKIRG